MAIASRRVPLVHFLLGAALAGLVLVPMLVVWYPRPLFEAAGTGRLAVFIAIADVLLGLLFVFMASRAGALPKSRLKLVAAIQLVVLAGCCLALFVQRPVYLVFTVDRFDLVLARDLDPRDLAKAARDEFKVRPMGNPQYVAALPPADPAEAQRIGNIALDGGKDLQAYPQHYVPYRQAAADALKRAKPVGPVLERDGGRVKRLLESAGRSPASVRFLPLRARSRDGVVLLEADSGLPLAVILVDPW